MILARKLRSAIRLYRRGGLSTIAEVAWDQSRCYIESNSILPRRHSQRALLMTRIFNDRIDYPHLTFEAVDAEGCNPVLLVPYLRRQFFDVIRLANLDRLTDGDIVPVADSLYRRWEFARLDRYLASWRTRLAGTKASPVLDVMARRVALRLGRLSEAAFALPLEGGDLVTCFLQAEVFDAQSRMTESSKAFATALRLHPDEPIVRLSYAFHLLKLGHYAQGFENWGVADRLMGVYPLRKRRRRWRGEALHRQTLMVLFEHGLGDMIQMSRFLQPLTQAHPDARIVGRVPEPLVGLLQKAFPGVDFVASELPDPVYDLYIPSMQLPLLIGANDVLPNTAYLRLDVAGDDAGRQGRPRIGICWRGHPRQYEQSRSVPLPTFARLFKRTDADFVVLLNAVTPEESDFLDGFKHVLRPTINDFVDLGAVIASCDLIVSVDTAVPHVAGAAGRPTLLLSRPDSCWRWGADGSRSPWYQMVEVLRHPGDMDWPYVLAQADHRIERHLTPATAIPAVAVA